MVNSCSTIAHLPTIIRHTIRRAIPSRHAQVAGNATPRRVQPHHPKHPDLALGCTRTPGHGAVAAACPPAPAPFATAFQRVGAALFDLGNTGAIDLAPAVIAAAASPAVETASGLAVFPALGSALKAAFVSVTIAASSLSGQLAVLSPTAPVQTLAAPAAPVTAMAGPVDPDTTRLPTLPELIQAKDPLDTIPDATQLATLLGSNVPASLRAEALPAPLHPNTDPVDVPEPASILVFTLAAAATLGGRKLSPARAPSPWQ